MIDGVQSGIGRTGKWFASWADIVPDVMTLARAWPAACRSARCWPRPRSGRVHPGSHGTTFGGGPLVYAAGRRCWTLESDHLLDNAHAVGEHLKAKLAASLAGLYGVTRCRRDLIAGIEQPDPRRAGAARPGGRPLDQRHPRPRLRLLPPLVLSRAEADQIVGILAPAVRPFRPNIHGQPPAQA